MSVEEEGINNKNPVLMRLTTQSEMAASSKVF
jgi:hypothetical protein